MKVECLLCPDLFHCIFEECLHIFPADVCLAGKQFFDGLQFRILHSEGFGLRYNYGSDVIVPIIICLGSCQKAKEKRASINQRVTIGNSRQ